MRNIRTMIAVIMIVMLSIFFGSMMMRNYQDSADAIVEAEKDQIQTIAEGTARTIESLLLDIKKSVYILSQDKGFQDGFKLLNLDSEEYNNTSIKIFYKIESPRVDKVQILDASGIIIDEYPRNVENIGLEMMDKGDVLRTIVSNSSNFSSVQYENINTPYIYLNTPIFADQKFQGIIRVKISVKYIYDKYLSKIQIHENGYASIISRAGEVIMFPRFDVIGNPLMAYALENYPDENWSGMEKAMESVSRGVSGTVSYESIWLSERIPRISKKLVGYAPVYIDDNYWMIWIVSDHEEVIATMRDNYYATVGISMAVTFGFIILTAYILIIRNKKRKLEDEAKYVRQVEELNEQLQKDLNQRILLQDQISRSKEKYEAIFDSGSDCMFVLDYDENEIGRILEINGRTVNRLGYERKELFNQPFLKYVNGMEDTLKDQILHALNNKGAALFETYLKKKNQANVPVEISMRMFELQGEKKLVLISRDISKRMMAEAAVKRSEERFGNIVSMLTREMNADPDETILFPGVNNSNVEIALKLENINLQLEKMFKKEIDESRKKEALMLHQSRYVAMGEMIGNIAHQWRQPLNTLSIIMTNIKEVVYEDPIEYEILEKMLDKSKDLIKNMSQTIDDFRYFFKPQESKEAFSVKESIKRTLHLTEERLKYQKIDVEIVGDNYMIFGYPNQFSQIILNLMNNSVDALVENRPNNRFIQVEIGRKDQNTFVQIRDNGGGIPKNIIDQIFEPYVTSKSDKNGTGLGLYMSKMIIERNFDGVIRVENSIDGAVFTMEFKGDNQNIS